MKPRLYWASVIGGLIATHPSARAERVRTIYANDQTIQTVYLSMGRATVLRFDEKPKTAIIGNQNYFSAEFLGNDISIQPLGATSTNIFVYTESQTYGLILKVGPPAQYDDIVYVRYKPAYVSVESPSKKSAQVGVEQRLGTELEIPGCLRFRFEKALQTIVGIWIVGVTIDNLSGEKIAANDIQVTLLDGPTEIKSSNFVLRQDSLTTGASSEARILARFSSLAAITVRVSCRGKTEERKLVDSRRSLLRHLRRH